VAAIGGKDSMSGSFKELDVPPTLVSFAVTLAPDAEKIVSPEFKNTDNHVLLLPLTCDRHEIPHWDKLNAALRLIHSLIQEGLVLSAQTVGQGGIAAAVSKMCFGNKIGLRFDEEWEPELLFAPELGSIILEMQGSLSEDRLEELFGAEDVLYDYLGKTDKTPYIRINGEKISLEKCVEAWKEPLESIFPTVCEIGKTPVPVINYPHKSTVRPARSFAKPRVFIPVFPGTNCEYDTARAFEEAGAEARIMVFRNLNPADIENSLSAMSREIAKSQIIALPGGFSAGDEPEGSGKFIAAVFRNPRVMEATQLHLQKNDGLILGICNGFQALIKLGLLPYGEIRPLTEASPTLTFNSIGRHISCIGRTKVVSKLSPWFSECSADEIYHIAFSHGEGRFVAPPQELARLIAGGQVATQYVDASGRPAARMPDNPNGSMAAIEGITSPDGRVLGKMGHNERMGAHVARNIPGEKRQPIFLGGVKYFA
ncbi:MAG: phosphoribosylformylglycinamidine synthase subunit PurQ, partial [Clostridiales bacterium]|nr:phosphoribosylformylglycinamidine synthase subunit PurQ [Clostridiales bacterium]